VISVQELFLFKDILIFLLKISDSVKNKILLYFGIAILSFGVINVSAQEIVDSTVYPDTANGEYVPQTIQEVIIMNLLGQIGPIVGGIVTIGISFARKQGLKISAEAEEYLVNSTKSFVAAQSRKIYAEIKNNPQYLEYLQKGIVPDELKKQALQNVKNHLLVELKSDEFTRTAKTMLQDNVVPLIERFYTEHKLDMAEKTKKNVQRSNTFSS
jgi:hypothetical protein